MGKVKKSADMNGIKLKTPARFKWTVFLNSLIARC
jgi:hypothetical protein